MVLIASLTDSEGWEEEQQRRSRGRYSSSLISEIFCRLSIPTGYLMLPFLHGVTFLGVASDSGDEGGRKAGR